MLISKIEKLQKNVKNQPKNSKHEMARFLRKSQKKFEIYFENFSVFMNFQN